MRKEYVVSNGVYVNETMVAYAIATITADIQRYSEKEWTLAAYEYSVHRLMYCLDWKYGQSEIYRAATIAVLMSAVWGDSGNEFVLETDTHIKAIEKFKEALKMVKEKSGIIQLKCYDNDNKCFYNQGIWFTYDNERNEIEMGEENIYFKEAGMYI